MIRRVDDETRTNRRAWDEASSKYVREYAETLAIAANGSSLLDTERELLRDVLQRSPRVVHLQSGNGTDDVALIRAGARSVVGLDFSDVAVRAAQRRAIDLDVPCRYIVAALPGAPLTTGSVDLVYTGKGALIWMPDLARWVHDVARLLTPSGHLFVHEEHPAATLWSWDADEPRIRADRSYFAVRHIDEVFPGGGATRWQWSIGALITAVADAGLQIVHLAEYPEPFWRPHGVSAAAWTGRLPNSFALLARRPEQHDLRGRGIRSARPEIPTPTIRDRRLGRGWFLLLLSQPVIRSMCRSSTAVASVGVICSRRTDVDRPRTSESSPVASWSACDTLPCS